MKGVSLNDLRKVKIGIPKSVKEQTAIATALSDADALITSLEKLIAKKRNIKQGAMQELLKPKKGWVGKNL
ncbi:MAG: restriction endonuclease subunit S [Bacteroidota bacterium]